MVIHRLQDGESLSSVCAEYGVDEDILRMNNGFSEGESPTVGEELLVLIPTRTYVTQRGDTLERLALRFGVLRRELIANNPFIEREGLMHGRRLVLKYGERIYGQAAANGYYFGGASRILKERLPHFTYVTVGAATVDSGEIRRLFDGRDAVGLVRMADKIPLLRIWCKSPSVLSSEISDELCEKMICATQSGGYKGLVLAGESIADEVLLKLKRRALGCDLILFSEVDGASGEHICEGSDGTVFSGKAPISRSAEYLRELADFAAERESNRCMPEICPFAENGGKFLPIDEALRIARRGGCVIERDDGAGVCRFTHKRNGEYVFPSLKNIKATLDTIHEYGYMGMSFDAVRSPISHLMMYGALFGKRC